MYKYFFTGSREEKEHDAKQFLTKLRKKTLIYFDNPGWRSCFSNSCFVLFLSGLGFLGLWGMQICLSCFSQFIDSYFYFDAFF